MPIPSSAEIFNEWSVKGNQQASNGLHKFIGCCFMAQMYVDFCKSVSPTKLELLSDL